MQQEDTQTDTIETLRQAVAAREQKLDQLQHTIAEQENAIAAIKQSMQDRERALADLQHSVAEHEENLMALKQTVAEKELEIAAAQEAANSHEQALNTLQREIAAQGQDEDYKVALALTLANAAYDALFVLNAQCEIIAINDSAEAMFGSERPIGQQLAAVTGAPELEEIVLDALTNEEEIFEEQLAIDKSVYRVRAQTIRRAGNLFIGLALEDITQLVRLNRARRDMIANISHELRNPIANIRLIIDGLFHEQEKPKRKQSTSALRAIARETDALWWLLQELFDLSMIESGQAILRMVDTPVAEMINESSERLYDQSVTKDIKIITEIPDDLQVLADRDQIRRVILNLIHNAIKWSPPGGAITIEAEQVNDEVAISVRDNGPGVPEEHRERIFERFYQVEQSRSSGDGTGLGLAICKHVVEAHGGHIWAVSNAECGGGCFVFTLPSAEHH
ncbi:MAG: hypothetical protein GYB67_16995 [Chloroflexi bacterium]|nr:hypothetical protein [Chloroflexota bacterium]